MFLQVSVAEDRRFELLRGCPQHAFQQCWPVFTGVRHRLWPARTWLGRPLVNSAGRGWMRQKLRQEARRRLAVRRSVWWSPASPHPTWLARTAAATRPGVESLARAVHTVVWLPAVRRVASGACRLSFSGARHAATVSGAAPPFGSWEKPTTWRCCWWSWQGLRGVA